MVYIPQWILFCHNCQKENVSYKTHMLKGCCWVVCRCSPALIYRRAVSNTRSPVTFWQDTDSIRLVLPIAEQVPLDILDVALVQYCSSPHRVVACSIWHWSRNRVPGKLSRPLQAEVNVKSCPAIKSQRVEECLHRIQDSLEKPK